MELGSLNRKVLLTGAGFSRNWGGYTAAEMWSRIKGDSEVQENHELQDLLTSESSFEIALAKARDGNVSTDATTKLEAATLRAFQSLDRQLIGGPLGRSSTLNAREVSIAALAMLSPGRWELVNELRGNSPVREARHRVGTPTGSRSLGASTGDGTTDQVVL